MSSLKDLDRNLQVAKQAFEEKRYSKALDLYKACSESLSKIAKISSDDYNRYQIEIKEMVALATIIKAKELTEGINKVNELLDLFPKFSNELMYYRALVQYLRVLEAYQKSNLKEIIKIAKEIVYEFKDNSREQEDNLENRPAYDLLFFFSLLESTSRNRSREHLERYKILPPEVKDCLDSVVDRILMPYATKFLCLSRSSQPEKVYKYCIKMYEDVIETLQNWSLLRDKFKRTKGDLQKQQKNPKSLRFLSQKIKYIRSFFVDKFKNELEIYMNTAIFYSMLMIKDIPDYYFSKAEDIIPDEEN
jgi:hypothetical protein